MKGFKEALIVQCFCLISSGLASCGISTFRVSKMDDRSWKDR